MKRIVTPMPDGSIQITTPATQDVLDEAFARCGPGSFVVDDAQIPTDRSQRGAWVVSTGTVEIDTVKAAALKAANSSVAKA